MKTSKVISVTQAVNEHGEQKSWGNPEQGLNYDYIVKMEDGTGGIYSSKKPGEQDKFKWGQSVDYEYTPNSNPQFPGKIKPAKKEFSGGKSNESDPKTRASIERQTALKAAVEFNRERSGKTFDDVIKDASTGARWISMETPKDKAAPGTPENPLPIHDAPDQFPFSDA